MTTFVSDGALTANHDQLNTSNIHVSVTSSGLDIKHHVWRQLFFKKKEIEAIWRNAVIYLLRDNYTRINPGGLLGLGRNHIMKLSRIRISYVVAVDDAIHSM